jgi:uncharacterized protein
LLMAIGMGGAPAFAQPADQAFGTIKPAMFVARDDDTTIYVLGTLHFLPCAADTSPPVCASGITTAVRSAVASADEVWLEIANPNEAAEDDHLATMIAAGLFHDGSVLSDHIPVEDIEFIAETLVSYFGGDVDTVMVGIEKVMPWVLQALLGQVLGGLDGQWSPGVDFELEAVAHELGIPVSASKPWKNRLLCWGLIRSSFRRSIFARRWWRFVMVSTWKRSARPALPRCGTFGATASWINSTS